MLARGSKNPEQMKASLEWYEDHRAKVQLAQEAAVVQDLQLLLKMDREGQLRVEDELMGHRANVNGEDDVGDILIDSPVNHYHYPPPAPPLLPVAVAAPASPPAAPSLWRSLGIPLLVGVLGAAAGAAAVRYLPPRDSAYKVIFYDDKGNEIPVDRWPGKPAEAKP